MKKVNILLLVLLLPISTLMAQVNLKNGLVACYPFNANANDESGNNNNGTVNGATLTTDRFGKTNSAYNFDGSSYISADAEPFKNESYSFCLWTKIDKLPSFEDQNSFITVGSTGGDQVFSISNSYSTLSATGFSVGSYNLGTPRVSSNWTGIVPDTQKWYYIVFTRDKTTVKLYVDGILISNNAPNTSTNGNSPDYQVPTNFVIGSRVGEYGYFQFLQGSIDDIHIYNRAINSDEVKALYDGNIPQTITITSNNSAPCGGDNIEFTANGGSLTSKYQWKVNDVNVGIQTTLNTFSYNFPNKSTDYQAKITVEITDDEICFPNKIASKDEFFNIKNCTPCSNSLLACVPFFVVKTK